MVLPQGNDPCQPEGIRFTVGSASLAVYESMLVAQAGIEPTMDQLMRLTSLPRLVRAIGAGLLTPMRIVSASVIDRKVAEGGSI